MSLRRLIPCRCCSCHFFIVSRWSLRSHVVVYILNTRCVVLAVRLHCISPFVIAFNPLFLSWWLLRCVHTFLQNISNVENTWSLVLHHMPQNSISRGPWQGEERGRPEGSLHDCRLGDHFHLQHHNQLQQMWACVWVFSRPDVGRPLQN